MSGDRDPVFDRPVFILSPPRSGSTLLFETLTQGRGLFTIGGESHAVIEGLPALNVAQRGFDSNRLTQADATPQTSEALRARFLSQLRDRDGAPPKTTPVRMLEKTPKNALRIPFLAEVFPEARFVYLHRDPRQVLASIIEAWGSGRFRTYPRLPGWVGTPWSLLLVPGWRDLIGKPVPEIAAAQWRIATETLLADLRAVPRERLIACRYDALNANWGAEISRICDFHGLDWDLPLDGPLPLSRYTVSKPDPEKWRKHEAAIMALWPGLAALAEEAEAFVSGL